MITLITPTRNRPEAFALLETWIERQTYRGPLQWIVVNDGATPYTYHHEQEVILRSPTQREVHSLCSNVLAALPKIQGDLAIVAEDDDWLAPQYIDRLIELADGRDLVGSAPATYYNLAGPSLRKLNNRRHCSFGQTAFRPAVAPLIESVAQRGDPYIDLALWHEWTGSKVIAPNRPLLHVSVKSMPGEPGIGTGHAMRGSVDDLELTMLRTLIGDDADYYRPFARRVGAGA